MAWDNRRTWLKALNDFLAKVNFPVAIARVHFDERTIGFGLITRKGYNTLWGDK